MKIKFTTMTGYVMDYMGCFFLVSDEPIIDCEGDVLQNNPDKNGNYMTFLTYFAGDPVEWEWFEQYDESWEKKGFTEFLSTDASRIKWFDEKFKSVVDKKSEHPAKTFIKVCLEMMNIPIADNTLELALEYENS